MSESNRGSGMALVCSGDPAQEPAFAALRQSDAGAGARLFRARDLNDVDDAVLAGELNRVIFARLDDLLAGCWDEVIRVDRWIAVGATIEILELPDVSGEAVARLVFASWSRWNQAKRRRQVVAGVILSVIAILAAFLLNR